MIFSLHSASISWILEPSTQGLISSTMIILLGKKLLKFVGIESMIPNLKVLKCSLCCNLNQIDCPCIIEPENLLDSEGIRPDGVTTFPYSEVPNRRACLLRFFIFSKYITCLWDKNLHFANSSHSWSLATLRLLLRRLCNSRCWRRAQIEAWDRCSRISPPCTLGVSPSLVSRWHRE